MIELLIAFIGFVGAVFLLLASIGLVGASYRFGRSEAVTKSGTFGAALIVLVASAGAGSFLVFSQGLIAIAIIIGSGLLLAPILAEWDWIIASSGRTDDIEETL